MSDAEDEEYEKAKQKPPLLSRSMPKMDDSKESEASSQDETDRESQLKFATNTERRWSMSEIDGLAEFCGARSKNKQVMDLGNHQIALARKTPRFLQGKSKYLSEDYIWNKVNGFPYILQLYASMSLPDYRCCFISEYVPNGSLQSFIAIHKVLNTWVARGITAQIASAILFIHNEGIFHRDVSSANILICVEGKAKLHNFSHAVMNKTSRGIHGNILYQAPEVFTAEIYELSTDWFSLGACLYEMVMSVTPLEHYCIRRAIDFKKLDLDGKMAVILASNIYVPQVFPKDLKEALNDFLAKDPKKRLGYKDDIQQFHNHIFFRNTDWESLGRGDFKVNLPSTNYKMWWTTEKAC